MESEVFGVRFVWLERFVATLLSILLVESTYYLKFIHEMNICALQIPIEPKVRGAPLEPRQSGFFVYICKKTTRTTGSQARLWPPCTSPYNNVYYKNDTC
jgi:hypothetical protein